MNINRLLQAAITQGAARVMRKPAWELRREIAALKRQLGALRREVRKIQKAAAPAARSTTSAVELAPADDAASGVKIRPSGPMVRRLRAKLGLTQLQFAKLVGVAPMTIWKWERAPGRIVLRPRTAAKLLAARGLGKRAAKASVA
jgi:DNA-binding XRE family transcriptional regulator